jgi:hypothetical protein
MRAASAILGERDGDAAASADYAAEVSRAFSKYAAAWRWYYGCERRFSSSEFWARRSIPTDPMGGKRVQVKAGND